MTRSDADVRALRDRDWSYPRIAQKLGNRDHTTIMYGLRQASALYATDPGFAWLCDRVAAA